MHSATKLISGHSDVVMGVVVTRDGALLDRIDNHRRLHGAIPGPMEAWLALRGLRTLALRVERAQANATDLAKRLVEHPAIDRVRYPGYGAMISIEVAGGAAGADAVAGGVPPVDPRHEPGRRRVEPRAPSPVGPREPPTVSDDAAAALGRHRGRRGPLG